MNFRKMRKKLKRYRINEDLSFEEMQDFLNRVKNVILLDVRSKQEYEEGHLKGAILLPLYELNKRAGSILTNKNDIIIVYCQYGSRSKKAIKILRRLGYNNLYNLKGGISRRRKLMIIFQNKD